MILLSLVAISKIRSIKRVGLGVSNFFALSNISFNSAVASTFVPTSSYFHSVDTTFPLVMSRYVLDWMLPSPFAKKKYLGQGLFAYRFINNSADNSNGSLSINANTSSSTSLPQMSCRITLSSIISFLYGTQFSSSLIRLSCPSFQCLPLGGYIKAPVNGCCIA